MELPQNAGYFLQQLFIIFSTVTLATLATPFFLVLFCPLILVFWYIQRYFKRTSREMKRLESVTRSPVYSVFQTTLTGLATVRAFDRCTDFLHENRRLVDRNTNCFFSYQTAGRWLAIRLDLLSISIIAVIGVLVVMLHESIDPNLAGLSLLYAVQV